MNRKTKKPKSAKTRSRRRKDSGANCLVPTRVQPGALSAGLFGASGLGEIAVREYVENQTHRERVTHLEKVKTEPLRDRPMDVWDVRTSRERYWVITNPMNLYRQCDFPSLDFVLTFHVGLMIRVWAQAPGTSDHRQIDRLAPAFRRWQQASEALELANEADEFQAIGMRCRECLLALIDCIAKPTMVPEGQEVPKAADFIHWSEFIANTIAAGGSMKELRAHLKGLARTTWQLVARLTHARDAVRFDADIAVEATLNTFSAYGVSLIRHERPTPDRCPKCGSYRVTWINEPELDPPAVTLCEMCGWTDPELGADSNAATSKRVIVPAFASPRRRRPTRPAKRKNATRKSR